MQSSSDINRQIAQVKSEIVDISNSLDRLTDIQDLLGAKAELRDRTEVLELLQSRLVEAQTREAEQAKLDRRAEMERQRDDAVAEHAELDSAFEAEMLDLERDILDRLDTLVKIATKRQTAESRRSDAAYELRGRQVDWSNIGQLSNGDGWYSNAVEGARSPVRQALYELYAAQRHLRGGLKLPGQDDGFRGIFGVVPRPQELAQPDTTEAFKQQIVSEFVAKG